MADYKGGFPSPLVQIQAPTSAVRGGSSGVLPSGLLNTGYVIEGTVESNNSLGQTYLNTRQGTLTIQAEPELQRFMLHGAKIRLRVEQKAEVVTAKILTIDDVPIDTLRQRRIPPDPSVIFGRSAPESADTRQALPTYGNLRPALPVGLPPASPPEPDVAMPTGLPQGRAFAFGMAAAASITADAPEAAFQLVTLRLPLLALSQRQEMALENYLRQLPGQPAPPAADAHVVVRLALPPPVAGAMGPSVLATATPFVPPGAPATTPAPSSNFLAEGAFSAPLAAAPAGAAPGRSALTPSSLSGALLPQTDAEPQTSPRAPILPPTFIYGSIRHVQITPAPSPPLSVPINSLTPPPLPPAAPPSVPVLQTPLGSFQLPLAFNPLPEGAQIALELLPAESGMTGKTVAAPGVGFGDPAQPAARALHWQALEEAVHYLGESSPPQQAALQQQIPTLTPRLLPTTLFFLSALSGGSLETWISAPVLRALEETGHPTLVRRLNQDFSALQRMWRETRDEPWQMTLLPFWQGERIEPLRLYRRPPSGGEQQGGFETHRFIVEVTLSHFGPMQLDGFYKRWRHQSALQVTEHHKQLSLTLRTLRPLEKELQDALKTHYTALLDGMDMAGTLSFHQADHFPTAEMEPVIAKTLQQVIFD